MQPSSCACIVASCVLLFVALRTASAQTATVPLPRTAAPARAGRAAPHPATTQPTSQPGRPAAAARRTVVALLNTTIPEFRVDELPLREVLDHLRDRLHVNVVVHWSRLAAEGITPDRPITLRVTQLPVRTILSLVLSEAAGVDGRLAYRASADLILISTAAEFAGQMIVRTYDVKDLVMEIPQAPLPGWAGGTGGCVNAGAPVVGGADVVRPIGRSCRGGICGGWSGPGDLGAACNGGRERRMRELIDVIKNTVEPESWDTRGGPGTITWFGDRLIVRNSPLVHQLIGGPLSEAAE